MAYFGCDGHGNEEQGLVACEPVHAVQSAGDHRHADCIHTCQLESNDAFRSDAGPSHSAEFHVVDADVGSLRNVLADDFSTVLALWERAADHLHNDIANFCGQQLFVVVLVTHSVDSPSHLRHRIDAHFAVKRSDFALQGSVSDVVAFGSVMKAKHDAIGAPHKDDMQHHTDDARERHPKQHALLLVRHALIVFVCHVVESRSTLLVSEGVGHALQNALRIIIDDRGCCLHSVNAERDGAAVEINENEMELEGEEDEDG